MRSVEVPEYEIHEEVRVDPTKTTIIIVGMQNEFVKEGDRSSFRTPKPRSRI